MMIIASPVIHVIGSQCKNQMNEASGSERAIAVGRGKEGKERKKREEGKGGSGGKEKGEGEE